MLGAMPKHAAESRPHRQPEGELALIERIRRKAQGNLRGSGGVRLGIGDDCAILRPRSGEEIVVTTDFALEGRHFRRDWHSPESIGHRTLARGLSDIAAMGARPVAAFLSLALPRSVAQDRRWIDRFFGGLLELAERAPVPLAGGDTSESPSEHVLADIVLLGAVPQGEALRRDTARPGDRLFVTGTLGGAAVELERLATGAREGTTRRRAMPGTDPQLFPEPRLQTGRLLVSRRLASAAMDLSDGLSSDLSKLCAASEVGAELDTDRLPGHALLRGIEPDRALSAVLHGGEDYELLFTCRPRTVMPARLGAVTLTEIGRIVEPGRRGCSVMLVDASGRRSPLKPEGWEHLR